MWDFLDHRPDPSPESPDRISTTWRGGGIAVRGELGCNHPMANEPFPGGLDAADIRDLTAALNRLFEPTAADEHMRYVTARQVHWQSIAAMMANGSDDRTALQTVLSACVELLTRATSAASAAAHLRLIADKVAMLDRR